MLQICYNLYVLQINILKHSPESGLKIRTINRGDLKEASKYLVLNLSERNNVIFEAS